MGSNGRGNGFFIDGLENFSNAGGGVRPSISQEAAQEFQINRNSFSAEFGNALGGIVNVISKSGSNQLHGNAFGFLRHRSIQARNYFDPGKSAFTRAQAGATLGGAIKRDKTYFFAPMNCRPGKRRTSSRFCRIEGYLAGLRVRRMNCSDFSRHQATQHFEALPLRDGCCCSPGRVPSSRICSMRIPGLFRFHNS